MRLPRRSARIDNNHASRLPLRDRVISVAHARKESSRLLLEPVLVMTAVGGLRDSLIAAARAADAGMRIGIEQQCQVRLQIPAEHTMQLQDRGASEFSAAALVGLRRIGEAVA